jgi:hypothetical protein
MTKVEPLKFRNRVMQLEGELLKMPQIEMKLVHHFAPGTYMRELHIPKNCVVTGKIHLTEHLNIMLKGDITVWTEDGMKRIVAPYVLKSMPGAKRVGFAHEDTVWMTVHATTETDPDKIEEMITTNDFAVVEKFLTEQKLLEDK